MFEVVDSAQEYETVVKVVPFCKQSDADYYAVSGPLEC